MWQAAYPTLFGHLVHLQSHLVSHEADDAKDYKAGEETGQAVADGHHQRIPRCKQQEGHECERMAQCRAGLNGESDDVFSRFLFFVTKKYFVIYVENILFHIYNTLNMWVN